MRWLNKIDNVIAHAARCTLHALFCVISIAVAFGCAPQKAIIDRTAMDKIIWPGPPEKPRIKFLWSLSIVSGREGEGIYEALAGEREDFTDPRTSNRLLRPYGVFVDADMLYITDPGAYRLTIIDLKNSLARHVTEAGEREFLSPIGVVAHNGKIYVSDSLLKKVFIFDSGGKMTGEFAGEMERPTSLAIDKARGIVYVSDTLAHRIHSYSLDGKKLGGIGHNGEEKGEFNFPTHIWVDASGRLYVTDSMNFRVQIFSPEGKFETMFGTIGDDYGHLDKPKGIATDSDGNVYIVDSIKDMLKIFDRGGNLLLFLGQNGTDYGQFWLPSGIFIDSKGVIYVADTYNGRVQVFQYLK